MQDTVLNLVNLAGLAWWVEIITEIPPCTYYFGPFLGAAGAESALPGYIEDLEQEGAIGIQFTIKRCKPNQLTIFNESEEPLNGYSPANTSRPTTL